MTTHLLTSDSVRPRPSDLPGQPRPAAPPPPAGPLRRSGPPRRAVVRAGVLAVTVVGVVVAVLLAGAHLRGDGAGTSQNGWPEVVSGHDPRLTSIPWVTGTVLSGDVATVLTHVAERFDAEVEPIDVASSWGWAHRPVRAGTDLSNHASGTAIDLNATAHPIGVSGTFTDEQVAAVRAILADVAPAVRWGGDYDDRPDEMHFEIVADPAAVAAVAARLTR